MLSNKAQTSAEGFLLIETIVLILWKQSIWRFRSLSLGKLGYTPSLGEANESLIIPFNVTI